MFNNIALDVFIGLVFVFLLYSLLATIVQEIIATRFDFRAKVLEKAILRMLEDGKTQTPFSYMDRMNGLLHLFNLRSLLRGKKVAPWFYAHPLIKYLAEDNWYSKPSYISSGNFSKVLIDLLKGFDRAESEAVQSIHESIAAGIIHKLPISTMDKANPAIRAILKENPGESTLLQLSQETVEMNPSTAFFLRTLWQDAGADLDIFRQKLEQWFDDTMKRASGWYKKYTRIVLFVIGFAVAYWFNVDTLAIRRILSTNETAREQMVQMAISSKDHLDPAKILAADSSEPGSQSLLDSTYDLVAADASRSQEILGLGKPWRDTSCMCKDSLGNKDFTRRLDSLTRINTGINDSITTLMATISLHQSQMKSPQKTVNGVTQDSLQQLISLDSIHLAKLRNIPQSEYKQMVKLQDRCAYISQMRKDKWNLYSPNQAGGWETFFGWLITAFAVMLGAPFWFDLLSKLISLRGVGSKETAQKVSSSSGPEPVAVSPVTIRVNSNPDEEAVG